jgi:peptidyl-prolyl cis-trans isomerase B (cyclophilin B)
VTIIAMRIPFKHALALSALIITLGVNDVTQAATQVKMQTTKGDITLTLDEKKAPQTVDNFVTYARNGYYDGTVFHRIIPGFMIQGGGFTPSMTEKGTRKPIQNEADNGLENNAGTIAMARTPDPHSATAQFFINLEDNDFLDFKTKTAQGWGYAVFGKVTEGMDVVRSIAQVSTGNRGMHENVPEEPVVIEKVSVVE